VDKASLSRQEKKHAVDILKKPNRLRRKGELSDLCKDRPTRIDGLRDENPKKGGYPRRRTESEMVQTISDTNKLASDEVSRTLNKKTQLDSNPRERKKFTILNYTLGERREEKKKKGRF